MKRPPLAGPSWGTVEPGGSANLFTSSSMKGKARVMCCRPSRIEKLLMAWGSVYNPLKCEVVIVPDQHAMMAYR
jgi:hypothetical protein